MHRRRLLLTLVATPLVCAEGAWAADQATSVACIKEALALGTENAVKNLGLAQLTCNVYDPSHT